MEMMLMQDFGYKNAEVQNELQKVRAGLARLKLQGSLDAVRAAVTTEQILKAAGTASLPTSSLQGGLVSSCHLRFQHILRSQVAGVQLHRQYERR